MCKPGKATITYGNDGAVFKGIFNENGIGTGEMDYGNGNKKKGTVTIGDDFSCRFTEQAQEQDYVYDKDFTVGNVHFRYTGPINVGNGTPQTREDKGEKYKTGTFQFDDGRYFIGTVNEGGHAYPIGVMHYSDGSSLPGSLTNECLFIPSFKNEVKLSRLNSINIEDEVKDLYNLCKSEVSALSDVAVRILPGCKIKARVDQTECLLGTADRAEIAITIIYNNKKYDIILSELNDGMFTINSNIENFKNTRDFKIYHTDPEFNEKYKQFVYDLIKQIIKDPDRYDKLAQKETNEIAKNNFNNMIASRPEINLDRTRQLRMDYTLQR
jgi:hypothetical protein